MSEPRQWWICQTPGFDGDAYDTDPRTWAHKPIHRTPVHVIEYSAYEALKIEYRKYINDQYIEHSKSAKQLEAAMARIKELENAQQ